MPAPARLTKTGLRRAAAASGFQLVATAARRRRAPRPGTAAHAAESARLDAVHAAESARLDAVHAAESARLDAELDAYHAVARGTPVPSSA